MGREIEVLHGGVANAGAVVRDGEEVVRPAPANASTIHRFLRHVSTSGVDIAPEPIGFTDDGRERLRFIPGDVPLPPYPVWAQSDETLVSIANLIRTLHDASQGFVAEPDDSWNSDAVDPEPDASVICHNDVCLENVVFRDRIAVALLDFDFAAPARRSLELASFARMCVPVTDDVTRTQLGWEVNELPHRLRLIADAYGRTRAERAEIIPALDYAIAHHAEVVQRRVEAGDPGYVTLWTSHGGAAWIERRRDWWAQHRGEFAAAMW